MFRQPPPGPQPRWKRPLYLALTTLLGLITSYGIHAVVELWYLRYLEQSGRLIVWHQHFVLGLCALPDFVQYGLLVLGLIGGWLLGRVWWRWVYIERRWIGTARLPK